MNPDRPVLLYDGDCRFCRACARTIACWDTERHFAVLPMQDAEGERLLDSLSPAERGRSVHIAYPNGRIASAGEVLVGLAEALPGAAWLRPLLAAECLGEPVGERLYWLVAERRGFLSDLVPETRPVVRRPNTA